MGAGKCLSCVTLPSPAVIQIFNGQANALVGVRMMVKVLTGFNGQELYSFPDTVRRIRQSSCPFSSPLTDFVR